MSYTILPYPTLPYRLSVYHGIVHLHLSHHFLLYRIIPYYTVSLVAGNETGITTFQLDIKSEGLTLETLERALLQVRTALHCSALYCTAH